MWLNSAAYLTRVTGEEMGKVSLRDAERCTLMTDQDSGDFSATESMSDGEVESSQGNDPSGGSTNDSTNGATNGSSKQRTYIRDATQTRAFGASRRTCHDSTIFHGSRLYDGLPIESDVGERQPFPKSLLNTFIEGDARNMNAIPDNSVDLVVTSPPYNANKAYDDDMNLAEYLELINDVLRECYRVLVPGGRLCINVANLGRKPYIPLASYVNTLVFEMGFLPRGEVIWNKSTTAGISCAWGSFNSASNPHLRDVHEYIIIASKGQYRKPREKSERDERSDTMEKQDFMEWTKSIWSFSTASANRVGHPAPFPVELPRRCIELYSYTGDIVLDPFMGSGTTAVAAKENSRQYIGYDINPDYVEMANKRLSDDN